MARSAEHATRFDAHAHLSFAPQPEAFGAWVADTFAGAFSTTVSPSDHLRASELFAPWPSIKVGLGAHPWWVSQGRITSDQREQLPALAREARFIGEVGLDFGRNGMAGSIFATQDETKAAQLDLLRTVLASCAQDREQSRIFSFHAVRGADVIMDLLAELDLLKGNTAIFHWFSGSNAQLVRARDLGCCFSVNAFMLNTKRGREYAKAIPANRLLVETDLPEEPQDQQPPEESQDYQEEPAPVAVREGKKDSSFAETCAAYEAALDSAYNELVRLRGEGILLNIEENVRTIFA